MSYISNTEAELQQMLESIGVDDFEDLLKDIPASLRYRHDLNIPKALPEHDLIKAITGISDKNSKFDACFAGAGAYDHFIPTVIGNIISRSEFMTAYTPYQAEVSQGTLQAIYEFQSMICSLTGMPVTNASMYDGASALAEAALLAVRHTRRNEVLVAGTVNPNYIETIETYLSGMDITVTTVPFTDGLVDYNQLRQKLDDKIACFIIQSPNFLGLIEKIEDIADEVKNNGSLLIMSYDPVSLGILKTPAEYGADIACADGQPLGLPLSYGGPYVGLFSASQELVRKIPGRIAAKTTDNDGNTGYVLTLQTREQHIRREKATSNICTNQQLCALIVTVYLAVMGKGGIKRAADLCLAKSHYAAKKICQLPGYKMRFNSPFFKEFVIQTPVTPKKIVTNLMKHGVLAGVDLSEFKIGLKGCLMVAVTEKISYEQIDELVFRLSKVK